MKPMRKEIFNLKDPDGLVNFQSLTSNCPELVELSHNSGDFQNNVKKWLKKMDNIMHFSFKKIRITNKMKPNSMEVEGLLRVKELKKIQLAKTTKNDNITRDVIIREIEKLDNQISLICAEENGEKMVKHIEKLSLGADGVNRINMWKLKQQIFPKNKDCPTAKKNSDGVLVTRPEDLKELYVQTYQQRLKHRTIKPGLEYLEFLKKLLFQLRLYLSKQSKSEPWTEDQLWTVLKSLKGGKSADALGYSNELFKPNIIGGDLFKSILAIANRSKAETEIPRPFRLTAITSIYKSKGDKSSLENERGIFNVTKYRSIIDKLLYNDIYDGIDGNMTSSNCGGRKKRSIRDNLFIVYAVINDALCFLKVDLDIQFFDLEQCFDSMWLEETMNDLWETMEKRNDQFALIAELNKECDIFIKTPVGDTRTFTLEDTEQQGTVLAPLKCANQMDSISRECITEDIGLYRYRGAIRLSPLGMIDDLACVALCGFDSVKMNAVINGKINAKRLIFNKKKCVKLHVSKAQNNKCCKTKVGDTQQMMVPCVQLEVQGDEMRQSDREKYIGDYISSTGSNDINIQNRKSQGIGALSQIFSMLKEVSLGYSYIQIGLILRESNLLSKILLSSESWHRLFKYQIEWLEDVDYSFFRQLFNAHSKTSKEVYLIESGKIPIRYLISMRRIMFWWNILHVNESDMLYRVYSAQKVSPVQGDWVTLLETDKRMFQIDMADEEMKIISSYQLKNYLKKTAKQLTLSYVETLKEKHSKSELYDTTELSISEYLTDNRFSKCERDLLFKLRSRTIQVKNNFRNANQDNLQCELCHLLICTQEHVTACPQLTQKIRIVNTAKVKHSDIFGNVDRQLTYIRIYNQFWQERISLIDS